MRPDWHDHDFALPDDIGPVPRRKRTVREGETPPIKISPIRVIAEEPVTPESAPAVHGAFEELNRLKRLLHSRRPRHLGTV